MDNTNVKSLRLLVSKYVKTSTSTALNLLFIDIIIYIASFSGIMFFENIFLRILCGVVVGLKMASLFVIAHDAAHDSYTGNKLLNKIIGRIAFLPCYHNFSLWLIAHNRLHHQLTNIKGVNSWSPLSKDEYDKLPLWRRVLEQFYRSLFGIGIYYLIERWWKDKFYPYERLVKEFQLNYWLDFLLISSFLIGQIILCGYIGALSVNSTAFVSILLGFVLPLSVFSFIVGFSVYQQHTHETVFWFKTKRERDSYAKIEEITIHVQYPEWYNLISHNVMEHTAHHVDPRIPCYQLHKAQKKLHEHLGNKMKSIKFSFIEFIKTMGKCKLYDYSNHCWLDFNGNRVTKVALSVSSNRFAEVA